MGNGTFWGVDSVAYIDSSTSHGTLAHYVINYWFASPPPHDTIVYWGRYFAIASSIANPYHSDNEAVQLINEVKAYSGAARGWILPICDPPTATVQSGSGSDGNYWGNLVCQNISYWLTNGPHTHMPGNQQIYTFLDIESTLSSAFWQGWAPAVFNYSYNGGLPYYEAAYMNPYTSGLCSFLASQTGSNTCYAIWSDQPENASNKCYSPGPGWGPASCGSSPWLVNWQYSQAQNCPGAMVDLDQTNPGITGPYGFGFLDYIIYCA